MGAGQSKQSPQPPTASFSTDGENHPAQSVSAVDAIQGSASSNAMKNDASSTAESSSGYDRATRVCRKKKRAYDACYTAQLTSKEEDCDELFETYRTCFLRVIAKDMKRRGVKVSENSMIGEYKAEEDDEVDNNKI